jgi:hypothetical protein
MKCRFGYEDCDLKHPRPPNIKLRIMSDEEAGRVVLPRFAPVDRWRSMPLDRVVSFAASRYLKEKGKRFKRGTANDRRWSCGCVTQTSTEWHYYFDEVRHRHSLQLESEHVVSACLRHRGPLMGRDWRTGRYAS